MIAATAPETRVRIHNVNTGKLIEAIVQTPGGTVTYEGDTAIDGVPGHRRPDPPGLPRCGRLQDRPPAAHRQVRDRIQGIEVTCIDMAMPMVIMRAADFGKTGHERPAELDADSAFFARLEAIRREAGALMGLGDVGEMVIPKPVLVSAAAGRRHAQRPLLHAALLPPRGRRDRCGRHRHGLRACRAASPRRFAGPPPPGPTRDDHGRAPGRPHPDRARAGAAGCRAAGPARLARAHRPPAVRGLGVRSRPHQLQPIRETCDVSKRMLLATALVRRRCRAEQPFRGRSPDTYPDRPIRSWSPTPPAAAPTRSPA